MKSRHKISSVIASNIQRVYLKIFLSKYMTPNFAQDSKIDNLLKKTNKLIIKLKNSA